jgi:antitoxin component YwqK of YwqJK toxin-antitoxin module
MSLHKDYHLNGQLKEEGNYKNGEKVGKWTYWRENGQVSIEEEYDNEGKVCSIIEY